MAKLECPNCGKEYMRGGKKYEKHVKTCTGEAAAAPRRAVREAPPPSEGGSTEPLIVTDSSGSSLSPKQRVLNMLEVDEEQLTKQLGDVKRLISAVRNCEGSEGV